MTPHPARSRGVRRPVVFALLIAVPALVVVCLLLGLARHAGADTLPALVAALALTALPILGLRSLLPATGTGPDVDDGVATSIIATWIWTLAVLLSTPVLAPGQRSDAARTGADTLLGRLADPISDPVAALIVTAAGALGSDGSVVPPSHAAVAPVPPDASPEPTPDATTPAGSARPTHSRREPETVADPAAPVVLPYRGDGRELDIEVGLDGPDFGEHFRMIFDTGASFTTVTPEALARIDVPIPADAPRVTLNTAGGEIHAPLVLLDAVWMGDQPTEWVTVAACPSCTAPGRAGLLGLNVSSQFRVEIDYDRKRIQLDPNPGDRRNDVRPWLELRARGVHHGSERLEFDVTVENRAPRAIEAATVEIDCGEAGFAVEVGHVPAKGERSTGLSLPGSTRCDSFRLDLISARWVLDRF